MAKQEGRRSDVPEAAGPGPRSRGSPARASGCWTSANRAPPPPHTRLGVGAPIDALRRSAPHAWSLPARAPSPSRPLPTSKMAAGGAGQVRKPLAGVHGARRTRRSPQTSPRGAAWLSRKKRFGDAAPGPAAGRRASRRKGCGEGAEL
ncbi:hypothetical protein PAL_GLEAN10022780 [Pteropus alecto]|uniref:Uncharacterized protein n=1 Tax=Pteropus alecto TaxID=9402 RepID=L5K4Q4_PTEAL|nr:hypothetical protein PAL_GLEAN10022780 [Pteropus alecto]